MAKKFKDDYAAGDALVGTSWNMTLHEYLVSNAPDVIDAMPCMGSVSPAEYFSRAFEKEKQSEVKRPGKERGIVWPYAARIVYLARKFKAIADEHRQLVIDARKIKIFWRGDDFDMFNKIVTETMLFRDLSPVERDNYKKRVMTVAKSMGARHEMF